ncbi:MAG: hypothetical protein OHK0024_34410 [Thalassobaculales bacterium]
MSAYLEMGGHGAFIWPAYALSLGVLAWLTISAWRRLAAARRRLAEMERPQ